MNSIEAKGRNVEEAIAKALKQLNVSKDNVTIEVLEHPEDRFFGLFVKPAVVKATPKAAEALEKNDENEAKPPASLKPGWIEISNGNVRYAATEENKPTIIPNEHVAVNVNGREITEEMEVQPGDQIEIQPKIIHKQESSFDIVLDDGHLTASLDIQAGWIEETAPLDAPPAKTLEIKTKTVNTPHVSFTKEDVLNELKKRNITYGIDEEAIEKALERKQSDSYIIARGKPPIEGENGYIEFHVQYEISDQKPKLLEDGTVDFREIREIPTVKAGETIGTIHEPKEGKQGITVQNKPIQPRKVHEAIIKGRGHFVEGGKLIALESGTIRVNKHEPIYQIDIIQKLVHHGDVDLKSGNLSFIGDIEISGSVEETMKVEADERILVLENIHGATVEAGKEIFVNRNVIRSKLNVGKVSSDELEIKNKTGELLDAVQALEKSVLQLSLAERQKRKIKTDAAKIVQVLLKQKFHTLPDEINRFFKLMHDHSNKRGIQVNELIDLLYRAFIHLDKQLLNDEMIFLTIIEKLSTLYRHYEDKLKPDGKLTIGQAHQSEVFCNGDIYLTGRGAYNSTFHAEGKFFAKGFIRGGSIFANKGIEVNEVGSGFGVETVLAVSEHEKIIIHHAKEDTVIKIGKRMHRFVNERRNVKAQLDETGAIVFT